MDWLGLEPTSLPSDPVPLIWRLSERSLCMVLTGASSSMLSNTPCSSPLVLSGLPDMAIQQIEALRQGVWAGASFGGLWTFARSQSPSIHSK
tara:strand:- start:98 stop:373 length:276 start_codon:yes stop_codon:yes gene_type:complete